jgi:hypothetical protein
MTKLPRQCVAWRDARDRWFEAGYTVSIDSNKPPAVDACVQRRASVTRYG